MEGREREGRVRDRGAREGGREGGRRKGGREGGREGDSEREREIETITVSPQQVTHLSLCGIFYFPWHIHQI